MEVLRAEFWRKIWNSWELRAMVLFTLAVQIVLIFFGHKRKSSYNLKLRIAVWSAYLTADSVATVTLGVLSSKLGDALPWPSGSKVSHDIYHLHGLDDYLSYLSYLSSVMALVGIVKYGGESALFGWRATTISSSPCWPRLIRINYPHFMEEYTLKQAEGNTSKSIFKAIDYVKAFRIVEIELGFIYDLLHTKDMSHLSRVDLSITYLLLAIIVFFKTYTILMLVSSDWSVVWLRKHNKNHCLGDPGGHIQLPNSACSAFAVKRGPWFCQNVLEFLKIREKLEKYQYTLDEDVSKEIRNLVFRHVKEDLYNTEEYHLPVRTDLQKSLAKLLVGYGLSQVEWATEGHFHQVVLTWYIATELSYYSDKEKVKNESGLPHFRESKLLSRYMLYLLVMYPSMLPSGIGEIRLRDTSAEALKFFEDHQMPNSKSNREPNWWIKNLVINRGK
ncbi:hypothetical protein NL676_028435, partial [Syzygium grande]